jgi:hypothetical protein
MTGTQRAHNCVRCVLQPQTCSVYLEGSNAFEMSALKVDESTFLISQFTEFTEVSRCP